MFGPTANSIGEGSIVERQHPAEDRTDDLAHVQTEERDVASRRHEVAARGRTERVRTVLDQPDLVAESILGASDDGAEADGVLGIAERVRRDDGAGSRCDRVRNPFRSRVVVVEGDVDEHRGVAAQRDCVRDYGTGVRGHHDLGVVNADCLEERPLGGTPVCERDRIRSAELCGEAPLEVRNPMSCREGQGAELLRPKRNAEPRNHRSRSSCSCQ